MVSLQATLGDGYKDGQSCVAKADEKAEEQTRTIEYSIFNYEETVILHDRQGYKKMSQDRRTVASGLAASSARIRTSASGWVAGARHVWSWHT